MEWNKLLNSTRPRPSTGGDSRVEFERDYDRSIFSTPVKRLQDKAQVFPLEPHDAIRTRLTHSLEVSAVARGLAIFVGKQLVEQDLISTKQQREIEAIAATCGLIHDLGNPPFGHAGEYAIREWFQRPKDPTIEKLLKSKKQLINDFSKFDGNAQSLRLVSKLQILADFNGLNLTYGTLSAAMKYTASSVEADEDHPNHSKSKLGFFASENDLVQQIRSATETNDSRNPIAFLVEAADDIVYSVADIEDGIKKGVVDWEDVYQDIKNSALDDLKEVVKRMKRILSSSGKTFKELEDEILGSAFRTAAIWVLVEDASEVFLKNYNLIMSGTFRSELLTNGKRKQLVETLKTIGRLKIYRTPSNLKLELMGRKIVLDLMELFWEGSKDLPSEDKKIKPKNFPGKIQLLFSSNYRSVFYEALRTSKFPDSYHRLQLVTDYVCGMTDSFAKRLHSELTNG